MSDIIVDIAVGVSVHKTFHYRAPEALSNMLAPGTRVLVPFGSRRITGTVLGVPTTAVVDGLKHIITILDNPVSSPLLELARWMADYYLHPLGLTIESLQPGALARIRPKRKTYVRLARGVSRQEVRGRKQAELLALLSRDQEVERGTLEGFSSATVKTLQEKGLIELSERECADPPPSMRVEPETPPHLMPAQADAIAHISQAVSSGAFHAFLLHGVTGSGKTEVYLRCIERLRSTGLGAIVLVPEIALTPQLLGRFRRRFGTQVAVLHSGLTDRARVDEYRRIASGRVAVAIGARSAVFAPIPRLGIVIVDEEHENSYKQEEGLRYHAGDVAVMRAKLQSAVVVLGSATPSLESYYNAQSGKYTLLEMPDRIDHRPMPEVTLLDLKTIASGATFSSALVERIDERLRKNEQVLLLLNRRGFSSVLICRDCGVALRCPSCSVSLTYHTTSEKALKCHYCDHSTAAPDTCPSCGGIHLRLLGSGTQKIEEEVQERFPHARIARMDSDSVKGRQAYDRLFEQVDRREVDILLGTQMVAKGHDFPAVTLVGVIDADVGLNLPDLRAAERTFQLITQAAGRSGRGELAGEVIIQTMNPSHYSLRYSTSHDYQGFYQEEIAFRNELGYPPAGRMARIEVQSSREQVASDAAASAANRIKQLIRGSNARLLGPAPSPIAKVRGRYRFQLLLTSSRRDLLHRLAEEGKKAAEEKHGRTCKVIVDVDPVSLM